MGVIILNNKYSIMVGILAIVNEGCQEDLRIGTKPGRDCIIARNCII
jgi:hypothetical protein